MMEQNIKTNESRRKKKVMLQTYGLHCENQI